MPKCFMWMSYVWVYIRLTFLSHFYDFGMHCLVNSQKLDDSFSFIMGQATCDTYIVLYVRRSIQDPSKIFKQRKKKSL